MMEEIGGHPQIWTKPSGRSGRRAALAGFPEQRLPVFPSPLAGEGGRGATGRGGARASGRRADFRPPDDSERRLPKSVWQALFRLFEAVDMFVAQVQNLCGLGFTSLGEGGVARRSRVTEGVGAESGRKMTLAVFVAAVTPSDSPSASHLPQEEGFILRRFASEQEYPSSASTGAPSPARGEGKTGSLCSGNPASTARCSLRPLGFIQYCRGSPYLSSIIRLVAQV
jgi:hypothetical protein